MDGTKQNMLVSADATVNFTLVTKKSGPLTKIIRYRDGKPVKDLSECWLSEGTSQEVTTSLKGFAETLRSCKPNQAVIHGVCGYKEIKIVSEQNFKGQPGTVTRTKKFFRYPKKNALTLFDYDVKPNVEPLSHDAWLNAMSEIFSGFEQVGYVVTPSTSSCIYGKDGNQLSGESSGFHHYVIAKKPSDIPRFNSTLFKRLWLAGYGYIFISRSGAQLERTIYDQFVMSPERLDFVAGAVCKDGLEQRLPDPVYVAGAVLDTTLLPSLSKSEEAGFKRLVEQAKQNTRDEADTVRADYLKTEAPRLAKRLNVSPNKAREILSTRVCGKLSGDDLLELDNGGTVQVKDILGDPARYHLKTLRDPVEPEAGKYKAKLFVNEDKSIIVNSCLHGGRIYKLQAEGDSPGQVETPDDPGETDADAELWETAKELLPRIDFPEILPSKLNDSLAQLARSIGMSARSLPGICMSAVGAAIGDRISVSPKKSWREPLIFWSFDIRPSGEGKTPAMQALIKLFHRKQKIEHDYYDLKKAEFDGLSAKKKRETSPPPKPRGYISNVLTIEGLRADQETNKTGGTLVALAEASTLISSQNEYKSKGADREAWITLHDGNPIRTLRAGKSIYISNSRVSITGGIQPGVFHRIFNSEDGIFLVDGTVFRGLFTYDSEVTFDIDDKSWSEDSEKVWTAILEQAFAYSESQDTIKIQCLDKDAKELFFSWRNLLNRQKAFLPEKIRGFIPKAIGYSLRFAGVLHCIHKFYEGLEPTAIITRQDMQRGIDTVMFYLGQTVDVVQLLAGEDGTSIELTEQVLHLAKTLEALRSELDSGRLAIGYIHEKFNETCLTEQKIKSEKAMGALLRKCKLTIPEGTFNANSRRGIKCLQWDKKTNSFIETCPPSPPAKEYQGLQPADIEKLKSAKSAGIDPQGNKKRTLRTLKNQSPQSENGSSTSKADIADMFSKENKKPDEQGSKDHDRCSDVDENVFEAKIGENRLGDKGDKGDNEIPTLTTDDFNQGREVLKI